MIEFYFEDRHNFYEAINWCSEHLGNRVDWYWLPEATASIDILTIVNDDDAILFRLTFNALHCKIRQV